MSKHTIVIDFADAEQPSYSAGMEVLGGKVVAVAFADELERAEQLEGQRDELLEALESVGQEHDLLRWMKNIEQRRSQGSFGIAVSGDSDAIGWQEQAEKLKVLVHRREAAIARARGEA